jgi:hypothetical protein
MSSAPDGADYSISLLIGFLLFVIPAKERVKELKDGWIGTVRPPLSRGQALRDNRVAASSEPAPAQERVKKLFFPRNVIPGRPPRVRAARGPRTGSGPSPEPKNT